MITHDRISEAEKIADDLANIINYAPDYLPYSEIISRAEDFLRSLKDDTQKAGSSA